MKLKLALAFGVHTLLASAEEAAAPETFSVPSADGSVFVETFQEGVGSFVQSESEKHQGQEISITAGNLPGIFKEDKGLVLAKEAKNYAVGAKIPVVDLGKVEKDLVVQYEVRLQEGLDCGGAYIKLLKDEADLDLKAIKDDTPYSIMFGPDKCGATNKVHFIFRHQNPVSKEWEEKHLKSPPFPKADKKSHLYTLIVRTDNSFEILIDQVSAKKGSLLEDFDPPVNPPKQIDDPTDSKPSNWVDEAKMDDPAASKPEDWDEDAPAMVDDMDASKPSDWDDDAPLLIPDPSSVKPDDWDDEEDGDWEAPQVDNPKCKSGHCGEWKRPQKKNPAYKGKWLAPKIDNPAYKGEWKPKQIENPSFFEDKAPWQVAPIAAVAVEVWTMSKGIQFDNFYVGHDEAKAKAFGEGTWAKKSAVENSNDKEAKREKARQEREAKRTAGGFTNLAEVYLLDGLDLVSDNIVASVSAVVLLVLALFFLCGGGGGSGDDDDTAEESAPAPAAAPKDKDGAKQEAEAEVEDITDEAEEEEDDGEEEEEEEEDKKKSGLRKRNTRRAD